jgi:hypothetical protein
MNRRILATLIGACLLAAGLAACTPAARTPGPCTVGVVGDSITVEAVRDGDLVGQFAAQGCAATVTAEPARDSNWGAQVVEQWAATGQMPKVIVMAVGSWDAYTNPSSFARNVDRVMAAAGGRDVVWVNTWVNDGTGRDQGVNATLDQAKKVKGRHLAVINHWWWLNTHPEMVRDVVAHLTPEGSRIHSARIVHAVTGR